VSPGELVFVGMAVLFAAGIQTMTGFGFSLFAVPIMSMVIPTEAAVVIAASLSTMTSGGQAWTERHHRDRPTVVRIVLAALLGMPLGLLVLTVMTSQQLKIGLAVVIVVFLIINLRGVRLDHASTPIDLGAGFVAGVLSTSLSTNGPPLAMALHARHLPAEVFRGTISSILVVLGVISVVLFAATGHYTVEIAWALVVVIPAMVVGFLIGHRLRVRIDHRVFRRLVTLLLALTAVVTLISAALG
jgi:uncharacterized membrane protein YfcA